jgi:predicted ribosomally synthesized peptide with nif11-like leader
MAATDDFFKALSDNEDLRSKVSSASSAADAVKIAAAAGFSISEAELIQAYKSRMSQMSEEQLSSVAGGKHDTKKGGTDIHVG